MIAELLDEAENVIPAAAVQTRPNDRAVRRGSRPSRTRARIVSISTVARMVPAERQVILRETRRRRSTGALRDGSPSSADRSTGPCLCAISACGVVEEVQAEVEQRAGDRLAVHRTCFSTRCQPRGRTSRIAVLRRQRVLLAFGTGEANVAAHRVAQVDLALEMLLPRSASSSPRNPP